MGYLDTRSKGWINSRTGTFRIVDGGATVLYAAEEAGLGRGSRAASGECENGRERIQTRLPGRWIWTWTLGILQPAELRAMY